MSRLKPDASPQPSNAASDPESDSSNSVGLNIQRTLAIARNTFREAVRDRVLYNLVLFVLLLIGGAIFLGELSAGQDAKIIADLGFRATLLFGGFIAFFFAVGMVATEIERRPLYAV